MFWLQKQPRSFWGISPSVKISSKFSLMTRAEVSATCASGCVCNVRTAATSWGVRGPGTRVVDSRTSRGGVGVGRGGGGGSRGYILSPRGAVGVRHLPLAFERALAMRERTLAHALTKPRLQNERATRRSRRAMHPLGASTRVRRTTVLWRKKKRSGETRREKIGEEMAAVTHGS